MGAVLVGRWLSPSCRHCHRAAVQEVYEEVAELLLFCPIPVACPHLSANTPSAAPCLAALPSWASEQVGFSPLSGTQVLGKGLAHCCELEKPNRSLGRCMRSQGAPRGQTDTWGCVTDRSMQPKDVRDCFAGGRPELGCKWDFVELKNAWLSNPPNTDWGTAAASQSCRDMDLKCTSSAFMNSPFLSSYRHWFFYHLCPSKEMHCFYNTL